MKEQFDRILRNHIKDTFDHFDDHLADDAWLKFKDKKRRKRRGLIFWYLLPSGIAAALAILFLFNFDNINHKPSTKLIAKQKLISKPDEENISKNLFKGPNLEISKNDLKIKNQKNNFGNKTLNQKIYKEQLLQKPSLYNLLPEAMVPNFKRGEKEQIVMAKEINHIASNVAIKPIIEAIIQQNNSNQQEVSGINYHKYTSATQTKANKKIAFAIDANTYVNFSESGINDKLNLGLGILSEIKLSKQWSINTGLSLNSQTGTFKDKELTNPSLNSVSFSLLAAVPKTSVTQAKLVGLDIPLNLKYAFRIGKTKGFISTGISSYSVINERYVNNFSVINYSFTGFRTNNITTIMDNPMGKFSYFKFVRTLNISLGATYPLTKKSSLSIEPFMKYPLGGLGYQNLKIGASGLSFKLNFGK